LLIGEIVGLVGGFVNGGRRTGLVAVGEKGGIFEEFLSEDRVKFSTKFSANWGYSIIERAGSLACFG
jgi:hypothetical protein